MKMKYVSSGSAFTLLAFVASLGLTSCSNNADGNAANDSLSTTNTAEAKTIDLKPAASKPEWAPNIDDEMLVVIEKLQSYGDKPIEGLSPQEARLQHTPTDAVIDVMKEHNISMPVSSIDTMGQDIPVNGGKIHTRIYTPKQGTAPFPVIVYYHGGGWVIADLDVYDASAKGLAEKTGAVVVSVHYRQGPEHKFPTAHNDAFAAYQWVVQNAASIKGDAKKIAVAGESAGGNLACNMSIMARDKGVMLPVHQVLVYPIANNNNELRIISAVCHGKTVKQSNDGMVCKKLSRGFKQSF